MNSRRSQRRPPSRRSSPSRVPAPSMVADSRTAVAWPRLSSTQRTRAFVRRPISARPTICRGGDAASTRVVAVRLSPSGPRTRTVPPSRTPGRPSRLRISMQGPASRQWLSRSDRNSNTDSGEAWTSASAAISPLPDPSGKGTGTRRLPPFQFASPRSPQGGFQRLVAAAIPTPGALVTGGVAAR